mmetsp:Transcript_6569/g.16132  ORF Transcript_6569/g.16132 Transcript_6569/m.16132 type:complete len:238 (-) Transcript_6569:922-1635(-)
MVVPVSTCTSRCCLGRRAAFCPLERTRRPCLSLQHLWWHLLTTAFCDCIRAPSVVTADVIRGPDAVARTGGRFRQPGVHLIAAGRRIPGSSPGVAELRYVAVHPPWFFYPALLRVVQQLERVHLRPVPVIVSTYQPQPIKRQPARNLNLPRRSEADRDQAPKHGWVRVTFGVGENRDTCRGDQRDDHGQWHAKENHVEEQHEGSHLWVHKRSDEKVQEHDEEDDVLPGENPARALLH